MNIAIFTDTFEPQVNGVVSYVVDTATYLVRHGHKVLVVAPRYGRHHPIQLSKYPFKVLLVSSVSTGVYPDLRIPLPNLPKTLSAIRKFRADIVHVNDPFTIAIDGVAAAKILQKPIVVTFHAFLFDKDMLKNVKFEKLIKIVSALKNPLSRLNSSFHNLADVVICPSQEAQKELIRYGLTKPSVVIPNGINVAEIQRRHPDVSALRRRYGLPHDAQFAVYVGRVAVDKSINVLIRAWKHVVATLPSAHLVIIGFGPMERPLKRLAAQLGITDHVVFLGRIDRADIFKKGLYHVGDIYVSASKIENQSMAMIEAMAHGLPIIGVRRRGTGEIVNGETGILVPPDNPKEFARAVLSVLSHPKNLAKLAEANLAYAKHFDTKVTGKKLVALYQSVYKNHTRLSIWKS